MWDPEQGRAIRERVGEQPPLTASDQRDPEDALTHIWQRWIDDTAALQEFGVAPTAMCDASNEIASARTEWAQEHGRTTSR